MGKKIRQTRIRRGLDSTSKSVCPSAQNAWTDTLADTRNVAATELVVAIGNVADTPPFFVDAAPVTRLPENAGVGDFVMDIVARHGATFFWSNSNGAATERWILQRLHYKTVMFHIMNLFHDCSKIKMKVIKIQFFVIFSITFACL